MKLTYIFVPENSKIVRYYRWIWTHYGNVLIMLSTLLRRRRLYWGDCKEIVFHLIQEILFIVLQWTRLNIWLWLKLVFLYMVVLHVVIMLILFCQYVLNKFVCWSYYVIGICTFHIFILSANSLQCQGYSMHFCLGWIVISCYHTQFWGSDPSVPVVWPVSSGTFVGHRVMPFWLPQPQKLFCQTISTNTCVVIT